MDDSPPGFSVIGILQARILESVAIPSCRGSSRPRDWTQVSRIAGRFFTSWATGELAILHTAVYICQGYSLNSSNLFLPSLCLQVHSLCFCSSVLFFLIPYITSIFFKYRTGHRVLSCSVSLPDRSPSSLARTPGEILKRRCVLPSLLLSLWSFQAHQGAWNKH